MALIKCKECGGQLSSEATACPHCGNPQKVAVAPRAVPPPAKTRPWAWIALLAIGGLIVWAASNSPSSGAQPAATKEAECAKTDLQCLGDKGVVAAGVYCKDPVERLAKHSVKWIDGTFEMKFGRFRWKDQAAGTITYVGDKAEFQNGFGAFTRVIYECDLLADNKTVLDARVSEGRLPPSSP